jgi:hypothetical protein
MFVLTRTAVHLHREPSNSCGCTGPTTRFTSARPLCASRGLVKSPLRHRVRCRGRSLTTFEPARDRQTYINEIDV